ncbi:hypothetical protein Tco_0979997 [Tanacetum coccineum]
MPICSSHQTYLPSLRPPSLLKFDEGLHKARQQDKVYEEREESCWIPHLRTGIFYPKGLEGVTNEVPDGVAIFASNYWLRNNNMYRV